MKKLFITGLFLTIGACAFGQNRTQNAATTPIWSATGAKGGANKVNPAKQNMAKPNPASTSKTEAKPTLWVNPVKQNATKQSPANVRIEDK